MQSGTLTHPVYHAVLRRIWGSSDRAKHLEFEVANGKKFDFRPGQFIALHIYRNGEQHIRAFSIATAHRADNCFELCLNLKREGDVSRWLLDLKAGSTIEFTGPYGVFRLYHSPDRVSAFIATGTGIAPIRAMLQELYRQDHPEETWLIFGVQKEADILYRDEFEKLARENPSFHFIPTLSRPDPEWKGHTGYVQQQIRKYLSGKQGLHAYVCGTPKMVEDVRRLFRGMGYGPEAVSYEKFE